MDKYTLDEKANIHAASIAFATAMLIHGTTLSAKEIAANATDLAVAMHDQQKAVLE